MPMRIPNRLINLTISVAAILVTFVASELLLRLVLFSENSAFEFLRHPQYYADYFSDDDYWKLYARFDGRHKPPESPHPVLGWIGAFSRDDYSHHQSANIHDRQPVLLYGDSFAKCSQSATCFEEILNNDEQFSRDHYLLNYGVDGYGVDQIFLLLQNTIDLYEDPFVVFSLMTADLDRSILTVRIGQKPRFRIEDDSLMLEQTPIYPNPDDFFAKNPPRIRSYLYRRILYANFVPKRFRSFLRRESARTNEKTQINEMIILEAVRELNARRIDYVFVIFHGNWRAVGTIDSEGDWRDRFLKKLFEEHEIPYIWSRDIVRAASEDSGRPLEDYFVPHDGHPTTHYNTLIAGRIKRLVLEGWTPD
jgi:hypothetical protein